MILFYISVGENIGIGHLKRCSFLVEKLSKFNYECKFIIKNDKYSIDYLNSKNFKFRIIDNIEATKITDEDLIKKSKVIVLDLLYNNYKLTKSLKEKNPNLRILALDYFDMLDSNVNTIINLLNHNKFISRPVHQNVKYLEGVKYGIIREEFIPYINKIKKRTNFFNILLTFGGSDPQNYTLRILPILVTLLEKYPIKIEIIIGPNFKNKNIIEKFIFDLSLDCLTIHINPHNIPEIIYNSDIVISGSGTTAIEIATLGKPSILLPQTPEELNFSNIFKFAGFSEIGSDLKEIYFEKIINYIINIYTEVISVEKINLIGKNLCQGNGSQLICNEIIELYEN